MNFNNFSIYEDKQLMKEADLIIQVFTDAYSSDPRMNDKQFEVVEQVVERVCQEMIDQLAGFVDTRYEPLRWAMHGGPGTGKRMLLK